MARKILLLIILALVFLSLSANVAAKKDSQTVVQDTTKLDSLTAMLYQQPQENRPIDLKTPSFGMMLLKMILSLIVITIVLYFMLRWVKKWNRDNRFSFKNQNASLINVLNLGWKQQLYIVHLYNVIYILSVSPEKTDLVDRITDPEKVREILLTKEGDDEKDVFRNMINSIINKNRKANE